MTEAVRVLVPGGLLFVSFITAFAPVRDMAKNYPEAGPKFAATPEELARWVRDGRWVAGEGSAFTDARFAHPAEVVNYRLAADPSLLGGAEHLLYVGRRR